MTAPSATPLAQGLFGWAFGPRAGLFALAACAVLGAGLVIGEYVRPREGLRLPFEAQAGFYGAVGAGAVAAALLIGAGLRLALMRKAPYGDDGAGDA